MLLLNLSPSQECTDPLSQGATDDLIGLCMFVKLDRSMISKEEAKLMELPDIERYGGLLHNLTVWE